MAQPENRRTAKEEWKRLRTACLDIIDMRKKYDVAEQYKLKPDQVVKPFEWVWVHIKSSSKRDKKLRTSFKKETFENSLHAFVRGVGKTEEMRNWMYYTGMEAGWWTLGHETLALTVREDIEMTFWEYLAKMEALLEHQSQAQDSSKGIYSSSFDSSTTVSPSPAINASSTSPIFKLPVELHLNILDHLFEAESVCLGLTCKQFYSLHHNFHGKTKLFQIVRSPFTDCWGCEVGHMLTGWAASDLLFYDPQKRKLVKETVTEWSKGVEWAVIGKKMGLHQGVPAGSQGSALVNMF